MTSGASGRRILGVAVAFAAAWVGSACAPQNRATTDPAVPKTAREPVSPRPSNEAFSCDPARRSEMVAGGASAANVRFTTNCE
ncbi:MAG: hypothetical protein U0169_20175 [Polyangiaceae bacterium]